MSRADDMRVIYTRESLKHVGATLVRVMRERRAAAFLKDCATDEDVARALVMQAATGVQFLLKRLYGEAIDAEID